jgi:hypothetical protein
MRFGPIYAACILHSRMSCDDRYCILTGQPKCVFDERRRIMDRDLRAMNRARVRAQRELKGLERASQLKTQRHIARALCKEKGLNSFDNNLEYQFLNITHFEDDGATLHGHYKDHPATQVRFDLNDSGDYRSAIFGYLLHRCPPHDRDCGCPSNHDLIEVGRQLEEEETTYRQLTSSSLLAPVNSEPGVQQLILNYLFDPAKIIDRSAERQPTRRTKRPRLTN